MKKSLFILFSVLLSYSISAQKLRIFGEVQQEINLDAQTLSKYPYVNFEVKDKDQSKTYNAVGVYELFKVAGVTLGNQLRGESLSKYVVAKASDGYEVVFALTEFDPEFTDSPILIAPNEGTFRLIVPKEKRRARWIRELASLEIKFSK